MLKICAKILMLLCLFGQAVSAATIHVPGDQPTIQAGIDAAFVGDTVRVAPGIYTGDGNRDLTFSGKDIVLQSENGPDSTIIDAEGSSSVDHRCMLFTGGESSSARVIGFTFRGGYLTGSGSGLLGNGGGVICLNSSPVFEDCIFTENTSSRHGAGLYCANGASPDLIACKFIDNTALQNGGGYASEGAFSTLQDCIFKSNSANYSGALHLGSGSNLTITDCLLYANSSLRSGGAVGLYGSDPTFQNCNLYANSYGTGQIYCLNSNPVLYNSIIAFGSGSGGAIVCGGSLPQLYCCDIYANGGGDWVSCIASAEGINGNFSSSPYFCDPDNSDFHLLDISECLPENNECGELVGIFGEGCATDLAIFEFSPEYLEFEGTQFQADTLIDTINIVNIGTEPLNWIASWNAGWLEVIPTSGSAPAAVEIKVSAEALAGGDYLDSIIFESPDAFNSPYKINVRFKINGPCQGRCGNANGDASVNVSDAVFIIGYIFVGGMAPVPVLSCGNANGDTGVNISDVVYIINFVFINGNAPGDCHPGIWFDHGGDCCPY